MPVKTGKTKQQIARGKRIRSYGITELQHWLMESYQGHKCAICEQPEKNGKSLSIDHDHDSGKVRGLLCNNCNRALGLLKDDKEMLSKAIHYLSNRTMYGSSIYINRPVDNF